MKFSDYREIQRQVEEWLGGDLSREELEWVRDYLSQKIRNLPDFSYGIEIEDIDDDVWDEWLREALQQMPEGGVEV